MVLTKRLTVAVGLAVLFSTAATVPAVAQPPLSTGPHGRSLLAIAQQNVDERLAGPIPDGIVSWGVAPSTGMLRVNVLPSDPLALARARTAIEGLQQTEIGYLPSRMRLFGDLLSGEAITSDSGLCSAGFNARSATGTRYVITAGHCTVDGGTWSDADGVIGPVATSSFPTNDYGAIRVTAATAVSTPVVDRYSGGSDVTVTGAASAPVGTKICRSGASTGWHCGTVQSVNQTVNYGDGEVVSGLTETDACAEPGDSGGAFVTNPLTTTKVKAVGLTSGGAGDCDTGGTTFFQPIGEALSTYKLTLYTG